MPVSFRAPAPPTLLKALLITLAVLLPAPAFAQERAALVVLDPVKSEMLQQWRRVTGELAAPSRSRLAAEEPGRVLTLTVEPGAEVRFDETIATLDTRLVEIEKLRAEAEVKVREGFAKERRAQLALAQRDLARFERLRAEGSANESELDTARTRVDTINAQIEQADAEVERAQAELSEIITRIEKMTIKAPFAGRVIRKSTEVGEWLQVGAPVCELVALDQLDAYIDVPESLVDQLRKPEATIRVRVPAIRVAPEDDPDSLAPFEINSAVTAIIPDADPISRLVPVRVRFDNPEERAKPGMTVEGFVATSEQLQQLTIHKDAVLRDDAGEFVYFDGGGQAIPARIRTIYAIAGNRVVIESQSLRPGMQVIIEGNERLYPTQPITPRNAPQSTGQSTDQPGAEGT